MTSQTPLREPDKVFLDVIEVSYQWQNSSLGRPHTHVRSYTLTHTLTLSHTHTHALEHTYRQTCRIAFGTSSIIDTSVYYVQ